MTCKALTWIPHPPFTHFHSASRAGEAAAVCQGPLGVSCPGSQRYLREQWLPKQSLQIDEHGLDTFLNVTQGQYLQKHSICSQETAAMPCHGHFSLRMCGIVVSLMEERKIWKLMKCFAWIFHQKRRRWKNGSNMWIFMSFWNPACKCHVTVLGRDCKHEILAWYFLNNPYS